MAKLREITRNLAEEIREGIPWVIIWKTGKSWNGEAFWLTVEDELFEPEDLPKVHEILEQDPNAVMLNGYYCGHLGEDMSIEELEAGIRWHYEKGHNRVANSTALPDEIPAPII